MWIDIYTQRWSMRTRDILSRYRRHQIARGMAAATIEWREFVLRRFFWWARKNGIRALNRIERKHIVLYQCYVSTLRNRKGDLYHPQVQNAHISAIRRLFCYLVMTGEVKKDPTFGVLMARVPNTLPRDILSVSQVERLLEMPDTGTWRGVRDRAMLEVLYATGIRRNELLNLDINDIQTDRKTIMIREGKYGSDRVVPYGQECAKWLTEYIQNVRPTRVSDINEPALFISRKTRRRLGKQGLKMALDRYAEAMKCDQHITPHTLRHSCASHMSDNGADIAYIQDLLGHRDANTTTVYVRISALRLRRIHEECHPRGKPMDVIAKPTRTDQAP